MFQRSLKVIVITEYYFDVTKIQIPQTLEPIVEPVVVVEEVPQDAPTADYLPPSNDYLPPQARKRLRFRRRYRLVRRQ